jgi:hypothetical protein
VYLYVNLLSAGYANYLGGLSSVHALLVKAFEQEKVIKAGVIVRAC